MQRSSQEPRLKFCDDPMFKRVMEREDICRGVIERILGRPVGEVAYHNTEQEQRLGPHAKSVRMDGYLVESAGHIYDVEMQMRRNPLLPMRFRTYQSVMDGSTLKHGDRYDRLLESYIIFICMEDPFGAGLPVYRFERRCVEDPGVDFDCRSHWIALNASAYSVLGDGSGLGRLLRYVYTEDVADGDGLLEDIDAEVASNNDDREWAMMLLDSITTARQEALVSGHYEGLEEGRKEGREQGLAEGREQGLAEGRAEGEDRYAKLVSLLLEQGRMDDLKSASSDSAVRQRLFEELGL